MRVKIKYLSDSTDCVPTLGRWFEEEWAPWYGPDGEGNAKADLLACCQKGSLPLSLVALDEDDTVLGTASLKEESLGCEFGYTPWLAAFLVGPRFRRRGLGTALIAAVEKEARRLGFTDIYTSTDTAISVLSERGWKRVGKSVETLRGPVEIYALKL